MKIQKDDPNMHNSKKVLGPEPSFSKLKGKDIINHWIFKKKE